jgi:hypothetical protein
MIVVKLIGGIGNQMFQYAFYKYIKSKNLDVKIDINSFDNYKLHQGYELEKVFKNIQISYAVKEDFINLLDNNMSIISKARRKILGLKKTHYKEYKLAYNEKIEDIINKRRNIYFEGYWQSEKYFSEIKKEIKKDFLFQKFEDDKNLYIENKIKNSMSVSIHVRRGDFLDNDLHKDICTLGYYEKCIDYILKMVNNPTFFIFSDDVEWCKHRFSKLQNKEYINWNTGNNSFRDMQLMSLCKHNIIANSSFSWWGAWLNVNPLKIVVTPKKFLNSDNDLIDLIPQEWIRLDS